mmetsp:Transcript_43409/g.80879  ORF Transcript_43409/g.80879 Transcript_43409/m.80879 type:complete len:231 (+) Transcript_43409:1633-2325(+)
MVWAQTMNCGLLGTMPRTRIKSVGTAVRTKFNTHCVEKKAPAMSSLSWKLVTSVARAKDTPADSPKDPTIWAKVEIHSPRSVVPKICKLHPGRKVPNANSPTASLRSTASLNLPKGPPKITATKLMRMDARDWYSDIFSPQYLFFIPLRTNVFARLQAPICNPLSMKTFQSCGFLRNISTWAWMNPADDCSFESSESSSEELRSSAPSAIAGRFTTRNSSPTSTQSNQST